MLSNVITDVINPMLQPRLTMQLYNMHFNSKSNAIPEEKMRLETKLTR